MRKLQMGSIGSGSAGSGSGEALPELVGSEEQDAIWHEMVFGRDHLLVNAVAGSGKSTTCIEGARRVRGSGSASSITYLAFNKHIQLAMEKRADGAVNARTFHSLGLAAITKALGAVKVDDRRMWEVIEGMRQWGPGDKPIIAGVKKLASIAKNSDADTSSELEHLVDFHGVEVGSEEEEAEVVALTPYALERAAEFKRGEVASIDYDDMCWLPKRLELKLQSTMLALSDESQDLNPVQQWLALRSAERLVIVGDRHQAIYGFRGSDVRSMDNLAAMAALPEGWDEGSDRVPLELHPALPREPRGAGPGGRAGYPCLAGGD